MGNPSYSNGAAYGDLDGDGDLDLIVNNVNQPVGIYRNQSSDRGAGGLVVKLSGPSINPDGVGAKVTVRQGERNQVAEQFPSRGYLSSCGKELVFGVDDEATADLEVTVEWPDGRTQRRSVTTADKVVTFSHTDSGQEVDLVIAGTATSNPSIFTLADDLLDEAAVHQEEFHNDFDHEPLLLRKLSDPGPKVVKGDVNSDGLEDFVLLGGLDDPDKLYIQQPDGTFKFTKNRFFELTAEYESSCGAFFDIDGDGDDDLLLGAGGNEFDRGYRAYPLRAYENINGVLYSNHTLAPPGGGEVSCIVPEDIDFDGDMDVFIGGRAVPGNYGLIPGSFLYIRENADWLDKTPRDIGTAGMVTDAVWTDLNTDGRPDLVMVGDWMPITVAFMLHDAQISQAFQIANSSGWWNSVEAADLDGDGKEDLIATNWGLNGKFRASNERPLQMHVKDFDENEKTEFIVEWYPPADDAPYPFASKKELHAQLPSLRKKTLKYTDYAKSTYASLFTEEQREGAVDYDARELRSSIIWNQGEGNVRITPLPWQAQLTPQFTTAVADVNGDERPDLWLGGNIFGVTPQVGRADAGRGCLLINEGDRKFSYRDPAAAGIEVAGQVRDAQFIELASGGKALLVGCNDEAMRVYRVNPALSK